MLDAGSRQALVAVRSLGRRKLSVGAMETFRGAPAFSSRWCRAAFVAPCGYGTSAYLGALDEVLDQTGASLAIPAHDGTISLLRQHRRRFASRVRIALASEEALTIAVNKARTQALGAELGIRAPDSILVSRPDELRAALDETGLPAVLKPCESWVGPDGHGARVVPHLATTVDEAGRIFVDLTRLGGSALVQRYVGGRREAVSLLYADGKIHARFAQWAQRTYPLLGGDSVLRQSIPVPADIGDQAERLVREMDLEGYSEVEFRRDTSGTPFLMEVNPRLSASVEIAVRSGVDFPLLVKQWACGESIDRVDRYRTGGWMRYLGGDLRGTAESLRLRGRPGVPSPGRAVRDFAMAFLRPMGYDYFQWGDPVPALRATEGFLRRTVSQVWARDAPSLRRNHHGRPGDRDPTTGRAPRTI